MKKEKNFFQNCFRMGRLLAMLVTLSWLASACSYPDKDSLTEDMTKAGIQGSYGSDLRASITKDKSSDETFELYQALSTQEKVLVWNDKMEDSKRFFEAAGQISFINTMIESLNESFFQEPLSDERSNTLTEAARQHFSDLEIGKVFMMIQDFDQNPDPRRPVAPGDGGLGTCKCAWDLLCGGGQLCEPGCTRTTTGCSWGWAGACTGLCGGFNI